ncbi:MAG: xanthine dehydrogenase family protein subunit M [Planctomycetota bacterium]|nr:MAG: xanthine dehydrogenase family protein subunit M [Planctomycetota bacterium]
MKEFEFQSATTVDEAVSLLAAKGDQARVLTGGTDLIVQLREGLRSADLVVDVKKIPELMTMSFSPEQGLRLGAAVPCHRIYGDKDVAVAYPGLADAARIIGGWQIQSRASVGGNLCNSSPAADSIPPLVVHDAVCHLAGPGGRRTVKASEFCTAPGKNVLQRGELLVSLEFPPPAEHASSAYMRFIPRNEMDIAVVGAASWVQLTAAGDTIEKASIALAAVAPTPLAATEASSFLAGKPATSETFAKAGELASQVARPISDKRGTSEYRKHLAGVLTQRTLAIAVERARG